MNTAIPALRADALTDDDALQVFSDHLREHGSAHLVPALRAARRLADLGRAAGFEVEWRADGSVVATMPTTSTTDLPGRYMLRAHPGAAEFLSRVDWGPDFDGFRSSVRVAFTYDVHMHIILRGRAADLAPHILHAAVAAWALCTGEPT